MIMNQKITLAPVESLIPEIKPDTENSKLSPEAKESDNDSGFIRTGQSFDESFLDRVLGLLKDKRSGDFITNFIKESGKKLTGQVLVDLGAGSTNLGYCTSLLLGAAKYVAVEKFSNTVKKLTDQLLLVSLKNGEITLDKPSLYDGRKILKEQKIIPINDLIPASVVQDKMLNFLKRLPDNSVSILTSGIHYFLMDNSEYRDAIAKEIERVLSPAGAYISIHSDINTKNLSRVADISNDELGIKVFIKALK
jgi:hypothetical protein